MPLPRTIVVATDFSEPAEKATTYALELANKLDARVRLVHAWMLPLVASASYPVPMPASFVDELGRHSQRCMDEALQRHQRPGTPLTGAVLCADPRDAVVEEATRTGADLIVVGTHSRRGLKRLVLGSVAESIVRAAPCPVLVAR